MFKKLLARTNRKPTKQGDTLVEVALAIGILGFVVAATIVTMNATLSVSQSNLEKTMARNEIDVQAEAIRYIQNAYSAQRELVDGDKEYDKLWKAMLAQAVKANEVPELADVTSCNEFYTAGNAHNLYASRAFIVNTHRLNVADAKQGSLTSSIIVTSFGTNATNSKFQPASLYPRVLYSASNDTMESSQNILGNTVRRAEGIWVQVVCGDNTGNCNGTNSTAQPSYYDFYIRTCWESADSPVPNTIGTIIRLHNPDYQN